MRYANGDCYEGEWKDDTRWGSGEMAFANGDLYEGAFVEDRMAGHGRFLYKGVAVYEGSFRKGEKHGKGTWIDQQTHAKYVVEFKNDERISIDIVGVTGSPL